MGACEDVFPCWLGKPRPAALNGFGTLCRLNRNQVATCGLETFVVGRIEGISAPLVDIPHHLVDAPWAPPFSVGCHCACRVFVSVSVVPASGAIPSVSPRISSAIRPTCPFFPLEFHGQAETSPVAVSSCIVPVDIHYGVICFLQIETAFVSPYRRETSCGLIR